MVTIYGLKNCDTCRKALKALPEAAFVDVRAQGVPTEILAQAQEKFGEKLLNTRSTTWRALDESARKKPALDLMAEHPALMKRPLITAGVNMFLGWTSETEDQVKSAA